MTWETSVSILFGVAIYLYYIYMTYVYINIVLLYTEIFNVPLKSVERTCEIK
jgi:hypothetical protein